MGPFIDVLPKELQESFPLWYDFHPKLKEKTAVNPPSVEILYGIS